MAVQMYLVGGAVRDILMGRKPKDFDFTVEASSYEEMKQWLEDNNFEIFVESPQFYTIRARRRTPWKFANIEMTGFTFDFVLARKDGFYSDGRRPDSVQMGTIEDDLARRDLTINAIAMSEDSDLIDPYSGEADIFFKTLLCVGSVDRLEEDALRIFRVIRFSVTLGFEPDDTILDYIEGNLNIDALRKVSAERIYDELMKAFSFNTLDTLEQLDRYTDLKEYVFSETGLWLMPTLKGRK